MMQREVATRLAARPGGKDWGVLPALVQTFAEVRVAFGVSRRAFHAAAAGRVVGASTSAGAPRRASTLGDADDVSRGRCAPRSASGGRRCGTRSARSRQTRGLDAGAVAAAFAARRDRSGHARRATLDGRLRAARARARGRRGVRRCRSCPRSRRSRAGSAPAARQAARSRDVVVRERAAPHADRRRLRHAARRPHARAAWAAPASTS